MKSLKTTVGGLLIGLSLLLKVVNGQPVSLTDFGIDLGAAYGLVSARDHKEEK